MKLLHTADVHLLERHLGRSDRGDDFMRAFAKVVRTAVEERVDAGLVVGDFINSRRPGPAIIEFLREQDSLLVDEELPFLCTVGNHDYSNPSWIRAALPQKDKKYGLIAADNSLVTLAEGIRVLCLPYMPGPELSALLTTGEHKNTTADVIMYHGAIREMLDFPMPGAVSLEDLPVERFRYWALGDIHKWFLHQVGDTVLSYPGSTELCSSKESADKTVNIVTIDAEFLDVQRKPLETRKAVFYKITTEEQLDECIRELHEVKKDHPDVMVFGRYNPAIERVYGRITNIIDPSVGIVHLKPFGTLMDDSAVRPEHTNAMSIEDMLPEFIPTDHPMYALAKSLLPIDADHKDLVSEYVYKEMTNNANN